MPLILEPAIHLAVARDGLPRVADYDDGSRHVLYLDGALVRSMPVGEWAGALPSDPTPQESAAAIAARDQARQAADQAAAQLRQRVLASAQSAVGVSVDQLTVQQRNALIVLLLRMAGALDHEGKVRALAEWAR